MKRMIDKMRADFALVLAHRLASGEWEKGDEAAAGMEIARLVEAGDEENLTIWARWLAKLALQDLMSGGVAAAPVETKRACADCRFFQQPNRELEGGCAGREDLARLFGKHHPLRVLPADGGVSCARFARRGS